MAPTKKPPGVLHWGVPRPLGLLKQTRREMGALRTHTAPRSAHLDSAYTTCFTASLISTPAPSIPNRSIKKQWSPCSSAMISTRASYSSFLNCRQNASLFVMPWHTKHNEGPALQGKPLHGFVHLKHRGEGYRLHGVVVVVAEGEVGKCLQMLQPFAGLLVPSLPDYCLCDTEEVA